MVALSLPYALVLTMSKRKFSQTASSKHLNLYKKSYKGGGSKDFHLDVFQDAHRLTNASRVLYPGCHRHLTASLVFPDVTYIDCDERVAPIYSDTVAREYVESTKLYDKDAKYRFYNYNVNDNMSNVGNDYDLLISLSAGLIVDPCSSHVAENGYVLVNDSHSDARMAFVSGEWQLMAFWDNDASKFITDDVDKCFRVIQKGTDETKPITTEQAQESVEIGAKRKRSFKLLMEPMFFLFQKKKRLDTQSDE
jgi:hypothetical protein